MEDLSNKFNDVEHAFIKIVRNINEIKNIDDLELDYKNACNCLIEYQKKCYGNTFSKMEVERLQIIIKDIKNCYDRLKERRSKLNNTNEKSISDKYACILSESGTLNEELIETNYEFVSKLLNLKDKLVKLKEKFYEINNLDDDKETLDKIEFGSISLALIMEIYCIVLGVLSSYYKQGQKIIFFMKDVVYIAKMLELFNELKYKLPDVRYCNEDYLYWIEQLENIYDSIKQVLEVKISCKYEDGYYLEDEKKINIIDAKTIGDIAIPIRDWVYTD